MILGLKGNEHKMKDPIAVRVAALLDEHLKEFFSAVEAEHNLPKDALWKKWKEEDKPSVKKDNKKSEYQVFFSIQRNKMIKDDPNISFGDISKKVSVMWKKLTPDEKQRYADDPSSLDDARTEYTKLSTPDLKKLCNDKALGKFRRKEDMIGALVAWEEAARKEKLALSQETSKGRSKLELSAEDKEDEEEDFYFDEDDASSRPAAGGDDDDDAILTDDDDDIFDDEE